MSTDVNPNTEENVNTTEIPTGSLREDTTQQTFDQVKEISSKVIGSLGDAPKYLSDIFDEFKPQITVIGIVLAALIGVKMIFAVLGAINDVPVLAPAFELIGIGATVWFVIRYLWKADTRKELVGTLDAAKNQVIGKDS